ncbi:MAG TPA: HlyD family efflux transporter periplasmic adaptor subunit [Burkholderiaceae bacterium]|nr:HlyD family efflux transporter periplasmic adaptor subunit [Burkholderiaceae bacterium]
MRGSQLVLAAALLVVACSRGEQPDAYGNVEATQVTVSAEAAGRLMSFDVHEGQSLAVAAVVGRINPSELELQKQQADAQRQASESRVDETTRQRPIAEAQRAAAAAQVDAARAQLDAVNAQLVIAQRTLDRTKRLLAQQAATTQQLDQAERDVRVLEEQSRAQKAQIEAYERQVAVHAGQLAAIDAQRRTAARQASSAVAQVGLVEDRLNKTTVTNPIAGTVLATYVEAGEFVQPGQPLYAIANLTAVDVRAYIDETQLASVQVGQQATVTIDVAKERQSLPGTVTWMASEAQFTPTPVQTRDERADLVYAIKIRVDNSKGLLKLGMPVDVQFGQRP